MLVGIVGTGNISKTHIKGIKFSGGQVVFTINPNIESAKIFNENYKIPFAYENLEEGIKKHKINVLHICTPPNTHYYYGKIALENKIHIVMEKPLCLDVEEASILESLAKENNLFCGVCFNNRYYDEIIKMKEVLTKGNFGDPILIRCQYLQKFHVLPTTYSWRYKEEISGKMRAVTEIGSHIIDLIRYVTNMEIVKVSSNFAMFNEKRYLKNNIMHYKKHDNSKEISVSTEDACFINFKMDNGAVGNIFLSEISHLHTNKIELEITSRENSVLWNNNKPNILKIGSSEQVTILDNPFGAGFEGTFNRFISSVYKKIENNTIENNFPNFYDGLINVKVCEKIYESNQKNGEWVEI